MARTIPAPIIAVLTENLPDIETHASLDNLFLYADAPGEPSEGSKPVKIQAWLRRINKESSDPITILGKLIEGYMELLEQDESYNIPWGDQSPNPKSQLREQLISILQKCNLQYQSGGIVHDGKSAPSKSLGEIIKGRDIPSIEMEFNRALQNVNLEPREAVSAACNILESVFKVFIQDEGLTPPQKQDLQGVWKVVREHLGFDTKRVEDDDLKKILSGMLRQLTVSVLFTLMPVPRMGRAAKFTTLSRGMLGLP